MPSVLLGNQSGGQLLFSGWPYSGRPEPVGGVQLYLDITASGNAYIGLSGGVTVQSGGYLLSGGGMLDGIQVTPGGAYFIPKIGTGTSGHLTVYAACDNAASGQARLYWEVY